MPTPTSRESDQHHETIQPGAHGNLWLWVSMLLTACCAVLALFLVFNPPSPVDDRAALATSVDEAIARLGKLETDQLTLRKDVDSLKPVPGTEEAPDVSPNAIRSRLAQLDGNIEALRRPLAELSGVRAQLDATDKQITSRLSELTQQLNDVTKIKEQLTSIEAQLRQALVLSRNGIGAPGSGIRSFSAGLDGSGHGQLALRSSDDKHTLLAGTANNGSSWLEIVSREGKRQVELVANAQDAKLQLCDESTCPTRLSRDALMIEATDPSISLKAAGGRTRFFVGSDKSDQPILELRSPNGSRAVQVSATNERALIKTCSQGTCMVVGPGQDIAEWFPTADSPPPGSVVRIDDRRAGRAILSSAPYDTRVLGVVSGAGELSPALELNAPQSRVNTAPIALAGQVYVLADASSAPIRAGDLLVTAAEPGHVMRDTSSHAPAGSIVGKALESLETGRGLIRMWVTAR